MSDTDYREIEARWINLNQEEIEKKLESIGAVLKGEYFFQEWIFKKEEWVGKARRIRVRTDGTQTWVTYKANSTWEVDSTEEVEFTVSSPEAAVKFFESIEIPIFLHQEKKRRQYTLGDITFEIDNWPLIPMVLEIEGASEEEVKKGAALLNLSWGDALFEDQKVIHEKYFNIDLESMTEYTFEK
ncbi:CYTH domain-containing protein [Candidatus Kaiserbacteria bacterium]|nr:MAG: CYTH domain-containing protein [Candidatus Kaiserbacteria bacterium]